jgi:ribose/xylose/arabinose/galactoside ABC-type transport system permease subunit/ABC-type multidrug transport system ATPase subunit
VTATAKRLLGGRRRGGARFVGGETGRAGLALLCVALIVYVQLDTGNFITKDNFDNILVNLTAAMFVAAAVGPLLISGNVDLSIGGMLSLASVVAAKVGVDSGSAALLILSGLGVGVACGLFNGLLTRWLTISPIIVTLGTGGVYLGLAYMLSDGSSIFGFSEGLVEAARVYVWDVPVVAAVGAVVFVVSCFLVTYTVGGLRTYAIGGNRQAARQVGVRDDLHVTLLYVLSGVAVGVAALALTLRLGTGSPDLGTGFEIDILTALILGGIGFAGGVGRPLGIAIGLITIEVFNAAAVFLGLSVYFHQVARGGILLLALAADQLLQGDESVLRRVLRRGQPAEQKAPTALPDGVELDGGHALAVGETRAAPDDDVPPTLVMRGVSKTYGGVVALQPVDVAIRPGQVTCLVGDNGAGKSTLVKLMTGVIRSDGGSMTLAGEPYDPHTPADARRRGIEAVYQDLALCPNLGAVPNLILGDEPTFGPRLGSLSLVDRNAAEQVAIERLREMHVRLRDANLPISNLSGGQRQSVAIARAARPDVRLAVLDEPTAALGVGQTRMVLELVKRLARGGASVVVVSHDVENVMEVADRVVVLRLGRIVFDGPISELTIERLVLLMAGVDQERPASPSVV